VARLLPPGLSESDFDTAIARFREVVGDKFVATEDGDLARYRDPYPVGSEPATGASAAISPESTEQVQEIVRIANEYGIPLSPISTGKNNGYGGGQPRLSGAVVVDTGERMNRILEVNEKYGYALLEPGVTYFDLYEYLQANAPSLMLDCPDLGWGSLVGNTLDRGVGYTPYGDHLMWQTGLEVVLPTGDVMRTGMGAVPGSNTWQLFQYGFGPFPDGLFTQSNLGIVTKMGIQLMQRPPSSTTFVITFDKEEDLAQVVDIMFPLRVNMAPLQNVPVLRNIILDAGVVSKRTEWYDGAGPLPAEAIERMKSELNLGYWNLYGTVYGPPPVVEQYLGMIRDAFLQVRGSKFFTHHDRDEATDRGAHVLHDRHRINNGIPSLDEMKLLEFVPNGGHIGFSPVSAPDGADALRQAQMVRQRADEYHQDYAAQFIVGLREMHHIALLLFDTTKPEERQRALDLAGVLIDEAAAEGYGEYRTHNALMDQVMGTYNWGDGALRKFHEAIKDALDPNSIMAPGKSGIWGRKYRDQNL
jgi:4-cresol dehydrogenase (hydroxylating) flavoprotein subunit